MRKVNVIPEARNKSLEQKDKSLTLGWVSGEVMNYSKCIFRRSNFLL